LNDEPIRFPYLPDRIAGLSHLATNLRWSWSRLARSAFRALDPTLWHLTRHNPVELLRRVEPARLAARSVDESFLELYDAAVAEMEREEDGRDAPWFPATFPTPLPGPVAYFCAEFGLHNSVPIYSGGLGVLAGDHCKAASDLAVPLVGVGLFYTKGYFDQALRLDGWQEDSDARFDPASAPLVREAGPGGEPWLTVVQTTGRPVHVGAWRMNVGRVPVYLLDTNLEANDPQDRELCGKLYAGGPIHRLRQEWILGVGGVRVLRALGKAPAVWHANEGHAAFMFVERIRELTAAGRSWAEAVAEVRARSVFTTHTPVPAGHDAFSAAEVTECTGPVWEAMGASPEQFLGLGAKPEDPHQLFHMTVLALRCSRRVNGVARKHGAVSRGLWQSLWPGRPASAVPIGHVTNGVHLQTWMNHELMGLLDKHLGSGWEAQADDPGLWDRVLDLSDPQLWSVRNHMRNELMAFVREEARRRWSGEWKEAAHVVGAGTLLDPEVFTIGFARRFATYKRADLVFRDFDRLHALLVNPRRPVQIIFAGKAHPQDQPGKELLQRVYGFTRDARLEGRIAFLEDYELHLAHRLVQGVDLWLNLPRVPLEASGTSGMKAALNGVPQLSTRDGWWDEGYEGENGWALPVAPADEDTDAADAASLYRLLESEVVPLFYDRDARGLPLGWIRRMKQAIRVAGSRFTARRMVQEYIREYYVPAAAGPAPGDEPPSA